MTIDSGWVKILKKRVPAAFSGRCPFRPTVVFIDGQIKLMAPQNIHTWDAYFERQFLNTIEVQFNTGARVVVLGFDNYEHVPAAKAPTQRKRNQHVPVVTFHEHDDLPPCPPESMGGAMRNRSFKTKIITYVVRRLRQHYKNETHCTIVIDYVDEPEVLGRPCALPSVFLKTPPPAAREPALLLSRAEAPAEGSAPGPAAPPPGPACDPPAPQPLLKRGECDIKAFVWAELGDLLIVSTDGDFIPLSLVQMERRELDPRQAPPPKIVLYRMTTNTEAQGTKRSGTGRVRRSYEYVDVAQLREAIASEVPLCPQPARLFALCCSLTG